eukprot:TRINITY_DN91474_c0_g1_i1.p1 TRINITY_DN91474_c0_g1~~TRINITY_DN91474_c0_g1_i1.p1  ORF type:complete len:352 (-),score=41.96 TRINITY_DN91474_c0_g1_i1:84-1139(-)
MAAVASSRLRQALLNVVHKLPRSVGGCRSFASTTPGAVDFRVREALGDRLGSWDANPSDASTPSSSSRSSAGHQRAASAVGTTFYTKTHEWFRVDEEGVGTLGITQVAQKALGEIVYCRLPDEGERFHIMEKIVTLEAVKTVAEVHCPVPGVVLQVNPRLERSPALVTQSPQKDGWLLKISFKRIPDYLRHSSAVSRSEIEPILGDHDALKAFLLRRMLPPDEPRPDPEDEDFNPTYAAHQMDELCFDALRSDERAVLHTIATRLGYVSESRGRGAGRQLVIRHPDAAEAYKKAMLAKRRKHSPEAPAWAEPEQGSDLSADADVVSFDDAEDFEQGDAEDRTGGRKSRGRR